MSLFNYLNKEVAQSNIEDNLDKVLLLIASKGVGYTSELARQSDINLESINQVLYHLSKSGFIEKIFPNPDFPQPPFQSRMNELWASGLIGFATISRFSWWTLTIPGFEYIKAKFKGQGKKLHYSLIQYLELKPEAIID